VKFLLSTNMDSLHLRSGMDPTKLAELHGNVFREFCTVCKKQYLRGFDTLTTRIGDRFSHLTNRKCECGGPLRGLKKKRKVVVVFFFIFSFFFEF